MKSLAEALLIVSEVWDSTDWQERTKVIGRPWEPPYKFDSNVSTMSKEQAVQLKTLVAALKNPDSELGRNEKQKKKDKAATGQRQIDVWKLDKFREPREHWQQWVKTNQKSWELVATIDEWAERIGLGCDSLVQLSETREVTFQ